jgi:hypothetical protein
LVAVDHQWSLDDDKEVLVDPDEDVVSILTLVPVTEKMRFSNKKRLLKNGVNQ